MTSATRAAWSTSAAARARCSAGVLEANPHLHGVLLDLPDVVPAASERCDVVAGSFFDAESIPRGGDVYLLSRVLHDWDDEQATAILRNVRAAMEPGARLLVLERLIPPGDDFHFGKLFDLVMLVVLGGRDRSEDEYSALLRAAGFEPASTRMLPGGLGVIEAVA